MPGVSAVWIQVAFLALAHVAFAWQQRAGRSSLTVKHKTKFDAEMVPGVTGDRVTFPASNSRQIVRTASGQWLIGFDIPGKGLFLCFGPRGRAEGSNFSEPILLTGDGIQGLLSAGKQPSGISLASDYTSRGPTWRAFRQPAYHYRVSSTPCQRCFVTPSLQNF